MVMDAVDRSAATRGALMSGFLLVVWGVSIGIVVGLSLVHFLGWLGLHVDTGAGTLLRRVFLP